MDSRTDHTLSDQFAAALDWWREAGVDCDYLDEPQKLLEDVTPPEDAPQPQQRKAKAKAEPAPEPPKVRLGGEREQWPKSLEGFAPWWMAEPTLDEAGAQGRIRPRGSVHADLMVIVPMPEADDRENLLSSAQGKLIANMLRAMEIAPDAAYIASALPRHMPMADWTGLHAEGLGDVLLHHIKLAAPKSVLVMGRDILPLLGLEKRQGVSDLAVSGGSIQLLASYTPENLIQNARLRADLWRRWLDWTGKQ